MKILIFGFTKLKYMPYMDFYIRSLEGEGHEIHVLSWKRDGDPDDTLPKDIVHHEFCKAIADEIPKLKKIPSFLAYRRNLIKLIKKESFDFLISLHTLPAVLIYRRLSGEYKDRFILDYRDFTFENIKPYANIIGRLVRTARLTFVSSDAFRKYLPDTPNVLISHNIDLQNLQYTSTQKPVSSKNGKIRISFWGYIRHEQINTRIIDALRDDSRFELHYYGKEQKTARRLKAYCRKNLIENVFFHGTYSADDKRTIAENTDIVHNLYDGGGTEEMALGNKYYDALIFYLPQVCNKGSYMGELVQRDGVGIALNPYAKEFADKLWKHYKDIDRNDFIKACDARLSEVMDEYETGARAIRNSISS